MSDEKQTKLKDYTGASCPVCLEGKLFEGSLYDDWEGKLTCTRCKTRQPRYREEEE